MSLRTHLSLIPHERESYAIRLGVARFVVLQKKEFLITFFREKNKYIICFASLHFTSGVEKLI